MFKVVFPISRIQKILYQFCINFFLLKFFKKAERFTPRIQKARYPHQPPLFFREFYIKSFLVNQQATFHVLPWRVYLDRHDLVLCYLYNLEY